MTETMRTTIPFKTLLARSALALGLLAATLALAALGAGPTRAATAFTVNSTDDVKDANFADGRCDTDPATSGNQCTLRAAIEQANETPGADAIRFDIPGGSGVKTIRPASPLPALTEAVTIDGYTQPGSKKNTLAKGTDAVLLIEIDGPSTPGVTGLVINASNVVVRGLVINGFSSGGILVRGANARIEGNFVGTDPSGTLDRGNAGEGVAVSGLNAVVGGAAPGARNLISGNGLQGVRLFDSGGRVQGNLIGTKKDGTTALGNFGGLLVPESNNFIGGNAPGEANTIAFNTADGIQVQATGTGNRVLGNSIFANGRLGINLEGGTENAAGATTNDLKDPDTGANNLQNKPNLSSATTASGEITVKGALNSVPNNKFAVQFFSDPSGNEGKVLLGQRAVTTNANGNAFFEVTFAKSVPAGHSVTATATGPGGNTSEFSAPRTVVTA